MGFRLLFDEMTEAALADYCRKLGHNVERVVTAAQLGAGTPDHEIVAYAERENRLVVTYDDDFLANHDTLDRIGVLFQPEDRTPPFETANRIDAVAEHVDQATIADTDKPFHLTADWV